MILFSDSYFKMVEDADRPLLLRGSFTEVEIRLVRDSLDPRGLYLHIMPNSREGVDVMKSILGM